MKNHFIDQLTDVKKSVEQILRKHPKARDDNKLLILKVWASQNDMLRSELFSFRDFADGFLAGKYGNIESITRASRMLQEKNPELRGANYNVRMKIGLQTRLNINKE